MFAFPCVCAQSLSCVQLFETSWTVACQASQSMGFSRQEYWGDLPLPSHIYRDNLYIQFSLVTQLCLILRSHRLQHARLPCPSSTPGAYSNSCPSHRWCHPTSSVILFSSHLQVSPESGSFPMSRFFALGGQSIRASASASVLPINIQDWFPSGRTGWISLQSKGLSRVFTNTIVQKHQSFSAQLSLQSNSHIHTWLLEKP